MSTSNEVELNAAATSASSPSAGHGGENGGVLSAEEEEEAVVAAMSFLETLQQTTAAQDDEGDGASQAADSRLYARPEDYGDYDDDEDEATLTRVYLKAQRERREQEARAAEDAVMTTLMNVASTSDHNRKQAASDTAKSSLHRPPSSIVAEDMSVVSGLLFDMETDNEGDDDDNYDGENQGDADVLQRMMHDPIAAQLDQLAQQDAGAAARMQQKLMEMSTDPNLSPQLQQLAAKSAQNLHSKTSSSPPPTTTTTTAPTAKKTKSGVYDATHHNHHHQPKDADCKCQCIIL